MSASTLERSFERWRVKTTNEGQNITVVNVGAWVRESSFASTSSNTSSSSGNNRAASISLLSACEELSIAEDALNAGEDFNAAIESYDSCLRRCGEAWMHGSVEHSGLVARACGLTRGDGAEATQDRGECAVSAYRCVVAVALSGRAVCWMKNGDWVSAVRDAEAAVDAAPELDLAHERASEVLRETGAAGDLADEYARNAAMLAGRKPKTTPTAKQRNGGAFTGDSADELAVKGTEVSAAMKKCVDEEDWTRARTLMLYGGGCSYGNNDEESAYRDRIVFLERAKTIFVKKRLAEKGETETKKKPSEDGVTWLDSALVLAGFDNLSALDKTTVLLNIGNIFAWVGDFSGATELYTCGLSVIAENAEDESPNDDERALDDLAPALEANRVLCQLRGNQEERAWKHVRKLMTDRTRHDFAIGFLRVAEVSCARKEWEMAEQSYRIAARLDANLQVRHKIVLARRAGVEAKPALVDLEQLEELDKVQAGNAAEFARTPRFYKRQTSLTDASAPQQFDEAAEELVQDLKTMSSGSFEADAAASLSRVFTGQPGSARPSGRRKRKSRDEACSCSGVFSFLGWGSTEIRPASAEEEIFLANLLEQPPGDDDLDLDGLDGMDIDQLVEATTPAPQEVIDGEFTTTK
jgi:tetratricopeptide (TPR) repeat protein